MKNTKHIIEDINALCVEVEELRALVSTVPEHAELQKMRDRLRDHDRMVGEYHKSCREVQILGRALELAAINRYYDLTEERAARVRQHEGHEPWYEFERYWKYEAEDDIDEQD